MITLTFSQILVDFSSYIFGIDFFHLFPLVLDTYRII